jgi:hypothetical protein
MRRTLVLTILLCLGLTSAAEARKVNVRVGVGDQSPAMFVHPSFRALKVKQVRYFIPWNAMRDRGRRLHARSWVKAARKAGARPFLHVMTDDLREKRGTLPSRRLYRKDVGRLVRYFRKLGVRDFGAWNEANHKSQPTWNNPYRLAGYFKEMRRAVFRRCSSRSCRVVGLDVLDQRGVERYIRRFVNAVGRSYARRYLRVVGIHNYSDVNRKRTRGMRNIMKTVRRYNRDANFWLTETGGVVKFGRSFPCSPRRAANRLTYLFRTARRYRRHLQRVYLYNWFGGDCNVRFDAGLFTSRGDARPGYWAVKKQIRSFKR